MDEHRSTNTSDAHRTQVSEELRLLFASCTSEIAGFKQQQWAATNYGLLGYAAFVSLSQLRPPPSAPERLALVVLEVGVLALGLHVIRRLSRSIEKRRERLAAVYKHFTPEFNEAHGRAEKNSLVWFFSTAFITGCVISVYLTLRLPVVGYSR
jgi:hypothetical protein